MNRMLSIIAFLSVSFCSIGQNKIEYPVFKGKYTLSSYLSGLLTYDAPLYDECKEFMCALQFRVDKDGNIEEKSIKISEYVQGHLKHKLKQFINTTHGTWEPMRIDGKAVRSNPQVLIMHFKMVGGCTKEDRYISKNVILDQFDEIFKFNKKEENAPPKNATIHPPISVYFPLGHSDLGDDLKSSDN